MDKKGGIKTMFSAIAFGILALMFVLFAWFFAIIIPGLIPQTLSKIEIFIYSMIPISIFLAIVLLWKFMFKP